MNTVAVVNSKGGVGKTSIVANVAATAAASGWRTLAADLDPQGNLARDLGYRDRTDQGQELVEATISGRGPTPLGDVRPGLDVIAGGAEIQRLGDLMLAEQMRDPQRSYDVAHTLAAAAATYDIAVIDCPPATGHLTRAALTAASWALIPTRIDDASIDGLEGLAALVADVIEHRNPQLYVLGVVMFDVGTGDQRLRRETHKELGELLDGVAPVLDVTIRHSRRAARDMRRRGQVAMEYEEAALTAKPWYQRQAGDPSYAGNAEGLAADYQRLAEHVMRALAEPDQSAEPVGES